MNSRSIRFKLIIWYGGLIAILFVVLGLGGYFGLKFYLERITKESLAKRARLIASTVQADMDRYGEASIVTDLSKYYDPEKNGRFLRITNDEGKILYTSGLPKNGIFDPLQVKPLILPITQPYLRYETQSDGVDLLIYALPFNLHNNQSFFIETGVPTNQITEPLLGLLVVLVLLLPIVILVTVSGGFLLIKRALIPVDELTKAAARITSGNLSERLPVTHTGDELERLSIGLNNMIDGLEKSFHHISQFTADASHELRTPLTILHCELETIIQKPHISVIDIQEKIGSALGETERLAHIVDGLLTITRLDAGETRVEKTFLDVAQLTMATVDQMRLLAEDKNISLYCYASPNVFIYGDTARLKQVVVNLLDNAVKYTPLNGTIKVSVKIQENFALIEVSDTGIGISTVALPQIFDRFYRTDKARSREQGGSGLGLSIVKSICLAHGGDVTVQSKENEGSCFRVILPLIKELEVKEPTNQSVLTIKLSQEQPALVKDS